MADGDFADAIALLRAEHRTVENLFATLAHSRDEARRARLTRRICLELRINATLEEEILYPALGAAMDRALLDHAWAALDRATTVAGEVEARHDESGIAALHQAVARFFDAEERAKDGLFARSRQAGVDLVALRDRMLERKEELTAIAESGGQFPGRRLRA